MSRESEKVEPIPSTRRRKRFPRLSPDDPPEVIEGFLRNLERAADELAARREAMGLPDGRTMWEAEDLAVMNETFDAVAAAREAMAKAPPPRRRRKALAPASASGPAPVLSSRPSRE